ncbi:MAG: manganese efflux pump MntP family protein, partial [Erysipelotrichaceae bacterium]|nr:manganese efflux pump MntP family protein [Erysipelotrichaceae bacterium]
MINTVFLINSILLGVGLAMDAFSVSMANGLNEPRMRMSKVLLIAGTFAFFQAFMPMMGWLCVHTIVNIFTAFETVIPWIAFGLLGYIGGKMLWEGLHADPETPEVHEVNIRELMVQGVATSIDALSVGFTIADYNASAALLASVIIAAVTFVICISGVSIGKVFGTKLAGKASILGGVILIAIGIEILLGAYL